MKQGQAWFFWYRTPKGEPTASIVYEPSTGLSGRAPAIVRHKLTEAEATLGVDKLKLVYPAPTIPEDRS